MTTREEITAAIDEVTKKLVAEGKLIEAGFAAYIVVTWGTDALPAMTNTQLGMLRTAYFSGAQHLFASMMSMMDPGDDEPTGDDLARMDQINDELAQWYATMAERLATKGSA